jgi:aquaporin Z
MAYAVGGISGGHFNPAVSLGLAIDRNRAERRVPDRDLRATSKAAAAGD